MAGQLVEFTKLSNGDLRISLLPEGREEAVEISKTNKSTNAKFTEIIMHQICNGWDVLRPEEVGALTDSLILSDDSEFDDEGEVITIGNVWWFPNYQILDEVEELLKNGYVDFELGV
jgi:hypothetical protein